MNKSLTINGVFYDFSQLRELVSRKLKDADLPQWERDVFGFIGEWISGEDFVEVQTSGTTGLPSKYFVQKKAMLVSARKTLNFFRLKPADKALLCLSSRYIAGKLMIVRAFAGGLDLMLSKPSSAPLNGIKDEIQFAAMVPMQVQKQLEKDVAAFGKVKKLIIGGNEVLPALKERLQGVHTEVWETYGMTETLTHIALKKINGEDRSEWFETLPGVKVGKTADNRLTVEVEGVTEGVLETNDIVEFKDENRFRIIGRDDDVINTGGIKVMPQTVEKKIEKWIDRSFVVSSVPDGLLVEKLVLVIEGEPFDAEGLKNKFKSLPFYEKPGDIVFMQVFPRTSTDKIKRKEIKKLMSKMKND